LGCIEIIDNMFGNAPPADVKDLNLLLSILSFMPNAVLRWLVRKMATAHGKKGALNVLFRQLDFGLRGIIFGTYYSGEAGSGYKGENPHRIVGFELNRIVD